MDLTKYNDLSGQLRDDRHVDLAGEVFDVISTDYEGIRLNYFGGTIAKHGLMVNNSRIDELHKRIKKHTSDIIELLLNNHQKLIALYIMHKNKHISDVNSGLGRHPRNTLPILKRKRNEKEHPKLNAFFHADELKLTPESDINSFFKACAKDADIDFKDADIDFVEINRNITIESSDYNGDFDVDYFTTTYYYRPSGNTGNDSYSTYDTGYVTEMNQRINQYVTTWRSVEITSSSTTGSSFHTYWSY